jgi:uncharacterized caspase-like protein
MATIHRELNIINTINVLEPILKTSTTYQLIVKINKYILSHLNLIKPALLAVSLASFGVVAQAPLDVRVALIIGNAAYVNVPALSNSTNDAKSMVNIMRKLGFKVFDVIDGDKASMELAITRTKDQLKGQQAVAMLYYAGHGLQLDWHNYMVPVDAKLNNSKDVPQQTIDIEEVIAAFKSSSTRMNIIVLDACRDNPFADKASGKGLAQLDAPPGTFISFATSPGNVAEDGDSDASNGLFTQYLIKELQKPAKIEDVFKRVRLQVRQKSKGRQIPWESTSLEDDFAFNDGAKHTFNPEDLIREAKEAKEKEERLKAEAEAAKQRELKIAQDREAERLRLIEAKKIQEQQAREKAEAESRERERQLELAAEAERKKAQEAALALERAKAAEVERLKAFDEARVQAELDAKLRKESADKQFEIQKADWDKIKDSKNVDDFYAFLNKYPSGFITEQAHFAIEQLQKSKITTQMNKDGVIQIPGAKRFRVGDRVEYNELDLKTGLVKSKSFTREIKKIEDGKVYEGIVGKDKITSIYTLDGALIQLEDTATYYYDPPRVDQPGDLFESGKEWTNKSIERSTLYAGGYRYYETKVKILGAEKIKLPAGEFVAFKVEYTGNSGNALIHSYKWFVPGIGRWVKNDVEVNNPKNGFYRHNLYELLSYKKGQD